jgi:RHS repeat-associated protein
VKNYEAHRDLISSVANTFNGQPIGSFAYANDALARRVGRVDNGAITNTFGYNPRSELSSARMGTNSYGYLYDAIGNRTAATNNAEVLTYLASALNQYTNITAGSVVVPRYDLDGNLTNYNGWTFAWDGENRLIKAANGSTVVSNQYDYMSRRVAKAVGSTTYQFLYDGWAMIQETTGTQTNSYVYGLDLSGSIQGAGTVGGILSVNLNGTHAFFFYDANGNVSDLTDASGTSLAHYEWDPYGNATVSSGSLAAANPFRFSTKYFDDETGFLYYGFRYYSPGLGRWLSRNPLGEMGGVNLYVTVVNRTTQLFDVLGLTASCCTAWKERYVLDWGPAQFVPRSDGGSYNRPLALCMYARIQTLDPWLHAQIEAAAVLGGGTAASYIADMIGAARASFVFNRIMTGYGIYKAIQSLTTVVSAYDWCKMQKCITFISQVSVERSVWNPGRWFGSRYRCECPSDSVEVSLDANGEAWRDFPTP